MTEDLYIGLDGGQSGTRAVLADAEGTIRAFGRGPACDHITAPRGYESNKAAIHGAISDALGKAGAKAEQIAGVGMGLTSAPRELNAQPTFEQIVHEIAAPGHIWIDHDAASNLAGATAGAAGVMVIAGSGSIAYGINEAGVEGRAGGLGYLMGDEGSAWWSGIRALQAAAAAADGRGPETALLPFVLEHYNLPTIRHIHTFLYADTFTRPMVSGITIDVVRLAESDPVARSIITEASQRLANMVLATIRQIYSTGESVDIYPTGGVFRAGDDVMRPFSQAILGEWPEAVITKPHFEPVIGALIRGYQHAGIEITPTLLENLRESSQEQLLKEF